MIKSSIWNILRDIEERLIAGANIVVGDYESNVMVKIIINNSFNPNILRFAQAKFIESDWIINPFCQL